MTPNERLLKAARKHLDCLDGCHSQKYQAKTVHQLRMAVQQVEAMQVKETQERAMLARLFEEHGVL